MTETEAKEKWCPMVRLSIDGAINDHDGCFNRTFSREDDSTSLGMGWGQSNCIGSGCMMWQWSASPHPSGYEGDGYCGLARK